MSSTSKTTKSAYWQANFRNHADRRVNRSTLIPNHLKFRGLANTIAEYWESICCRDHSRDALQDRCQMIAEKISKTLEVELNSPAVEKFKKRTMILFDDYFPLLTIPSFKIVSQSWLAHQKNLVKESSFSSYSQCIKDFTNYLGKNADLSLEEFDRKWLRDFQSAQAKKVSNQTANKKVKRVCSVLRWAYQEDIINTNHADKIRHLPVERIRTRRPFTTEELQAILAVANPEWRSMIYAGYGTGQRLSDIATMRWSDLDLKKKTWTLEVTKTGKHICLPLLSDIAAILEKVSESKRTGFVHETAAKHYLGCNGKSSTLSNQFSDLLFKVGLKEKKISHRQTKGGRDKKRATVGLGFHCLRYTTATLLHENGAPQAVAQQIIGHSSDAVHAVYVQPRLGPLRREIEKLSLFPSKT